MECDEINMARIRAGDESAWRDLFYRHYSVMCYVAEFYLHDAYLAEVVAQDVFSHLWEIRDHVCITSSWSSYLLRSVRNRCLDHLKARDHSEMKMGSGVDFPDFFSEADHPLSKLLEKELEEDLSRAVESLPAESRTVFKKSRLEGKKYHEIARELGISVNTVKYHMKRALSLLREAFRRYLAVLLFIILI